MTESTTTPTIVEQVRERYAQAALSVRSGSSCCDTTCCGSDGEADAITGNLYSAQESEVVPEEALRASLGCGNPTALIDLHPGETVLDLGSGGGIDVLLSARRVGPTGFAYGVDMTDEMLALAQENAAKAGATNVAFLKGQIENVPLAPNSVDVVISNCVINLAADKSLVLREAFRVLKPGGRFAVADVVADGSLADDLRLMMEAWCGCVAGALDMGTYPALLEQAGFENPSIEITRRYTVAEAGIDTSSLPDGWKTGDGRLASAFIRATKPQGTSGSCCGPDCCA